MTSVHAKLSASGSGKWLVCTPSANLEADIPDEESPYAAEGTLAHKLFDAYLTVYVNGDRDSDIAAYDKLIADNGIDQEMIDYITDAANRAIAIIENAHQRCEDPVILLEQRLDFSPWVPEGFGTGDVVVITDELMEVIDLKYGKGVPVPAEWNSQMRLYALGAYNELSHLYDVKRVKTYIYQPRLDSWNSEELTIAELLDWAQSTVVPKAKEAWVGEGALVPGEHCSKYFCRARFNCPARNAAAQELVESSFSLIPPELLTADQMAKVLSRADEVIKWLNDAKEWAFNQLQSGNPVPGFKLVEGRSTRKYVDQSLVAKALVDGGLSEELIYERSLLGITAMEKLLGKKKFAELLGSLIEKPPGKPTMAPASDKRPAIDQLAYFENESLED